MISDFVSLAEERRLRNQSQAGVRRHACRRMSPDPARGQRPICAAGTANCRFRPGRQLQRFVLDFRRRRGGAETSRWRRPCTLYGLASVATGPRSTQTPPDRAVAEAGDLPGFAPEEAREAVDSSPPSTAYATTRARRTEERQARPDATGNFSARARAVRARAQCQGSAAVAADLAECWIETMTNAAIAALVRSAKPICSRWNTGGWNRRSWRRC